jgi:outer membrane cobalamin receptor
MVLILCCSPNLIRRLGLFYSLYNKGDVPMKQQIYAIIFYLPLATTYGKLSYSGEDSTKIYYTDTIVVTATRTSISPNDAPSAVRVISYESIQRIQGTTVADLLHIANGIDIKDYGAIGGMKNARFRGLSTENVLLLINGSPINDAQYGSVDLSLLPLDAIDRMEVSYGGSSALYGGNALGGVVNIITRRASDKIHARALEEVGSFGARRISAELQGRVFGVGMLTGISREIGDDYFPFFLHRQNAADTMLYRSNADYQRTHIFVNSDYQYAEDIVLNTSVQYVKFERGVPGSITLPSLARQNDEVFRAMVSSNIRITENILFTTNEIYNHSNELYREPSDYSPTDLLYQSRSYSMNSQIEWSPVVWDRLIGGIEYSENRLNVKGTSWGFPLLMNSVRVQKSSYISNEIIFQDDAKWFDRLMLYQTIRYDDYSDVKDAAFSPKLGVNLRVNRLYDVHIRSSWGKNFRIPTFNDLYYPNYSNSHLAPERSTAFDAGIVGSLERSGRQVLEITYFDINTLDKIALDANWLPYNIGKTKNSGLEIRYNYHSLDGMVDAYFGFTFIDAVKKDRQSATDSTYGRRLPYVPKSMGTFGVSFETEIGRININQTITSLRYTNSDNNISLSAYALTDVNFMKKISIPYIQLEMRCAVSNVFDVDYQAVEGYPMPGRAYKVSMCVAY